jgi:hypothetical protein
MSHPPPDPDPPKPPQITIYVNRPPVGGSISASPRRGVSLWTNFTLACNGWTDPEANLPLTYGFEALVAKGRVPAVLATGRALPSLKVGAVGGGGDGGACVVIDRGLSSS